jgi:pimeloyl-ACP methyl ester carboxylesterase
VAVFFINARGLEIAVETHGCGPDPILFIHGLGTNRSCWSGAQRYFAPSRYTLYCVDLPGFGESAKPIDVDYSIPAIADYVSLVVDQLHLEESHLVAHSMGGIVALLLTDVGRFKFRSLTLAEGNLVGNDAFMSGRIAGRAETVFVKQFERWVRLLPSFMNDETKERQQCYEASLRQSSAVALYRAAKSCANLSHSGSLAERFRKLDCPRAYVVGERTKQRRSIPDVVFDPAVTLIEVSGQGHFMMDNENGFYGSIARWIASILE